MRSDKVFAYPLDYYEKLFRHRALLQTGTDSLVEVFQKDVAEIASIMDSGKGRLYCFYLGFRSQFEIYEVTDTAKLREVFEIPSAEGWRIVEQKLENEKATFEWRLDEKRSQFVYEQWRRENNLEVDDEGDYDFTSYFEPSGI